MTKAVRLCGTAKRRVAEAPERRSLALVVAALFNACGPGDSPPVTDVPFTVRDSAGVAISVTRGSDARRALGWRIEAEPDLVLGLEGGSVGPLFQIRGASVLRDGVMLIVNAGTAELIFVDSAGHLMERRGGAGEGPGEYRIPTLIPPTTPDSILVFDGPARRFPLTSSGGSGHTINAATWPAGRAPPVGRVGLHTLLSRRSFVGGEASLAQEGVQRLAYEFMWFELSTGKVTPILESVRDWRYSSSTVDVVAPFSPAPSAATICGTAALTLGSQPEILVFDTAAHLERIVRLDEEPRPLTDALIDEWKRFVSRTDGQQDLAQVPLPDEQPYFQSILAGVAGSMWVQQFQVDPHARATWLVFDPQGRGRGVVESPANLTLTFVGTDFVLGIAEDSFGVERIQRHRLTRGDDPSVRPDSYAGCRPGAPDLQEQEP